ncbi:MAG: NIPSNAP family protein [Candidatus Methylomirabilales bacterium]
MIYELRTYQLVVGGLPEYLELARTTILPAIAEYGIKPVGFWHTETGTLHQVVHLWAYADLNDRQAKWAAWAKDPRRKDVLARLRPIVVSQHNTILSPTEFSPLQ